MEADAATRGESAPTSAASGARTLREGAIIADRYRVLRALGEGAMGAVYLVEHTQLRKRYALKVMLPEATSSPELVARFEREAVTAASIAHPGVAQATDFGRLEDGSFYLVLEYVEGRSLRSVLGDGPMHPARALRIARQILLALHAAHAQGVVHRDIKPENVMLHAPTSGASSLAAKRLPSLVRDIDQDVIKILDFGIAKIDANSMGDGGPALTRAGAIYGTPQYMAPEQAIGGAIDARVDLYALGATLFEMITGAPPFEGEPIQIIMQLVTEPPPPLASPIVPELVTEPLRRFVDRLLAKRAEERPASAEEAIRELDAVVDALEAVDVSADVRRAITAPPPAFAAPGRRRVLLHLEAWLAATSKRFGVAPRTLGLVLMGAGTAAFLLLVALVAIATRAPAEDDAHQARSAKWPAWYEPAKPKTTTSASPGAASASAPPSAPPSTSSSASTPPAQGRSRGGVIQRVKGLFR